MNKLLRFLQNRNRQLNSQRRSSITICDVGLSLDTTAPEFREQFLPEANHTASL